MISKYPHKPNFFSRYRVTDPLFLFSDFIQFVRKDDVLNSLGNYMITGNTGRLFQCLTQRV